MNRRKICGTGILPVSGEHGQDARALFSNSIHEAKATLAFTLIEMLVATALASILIGAALTVMSRLGRDRQLIGNRSPSNDSRGLVDLLRWDIGQANSIENTQPRLLSLTGHGGINRSTLLPDMRWVQITYRIVANSGKSSLWRSQEYLDDPARPDPWQEWIGDGITGLEAQSSNSSAAGSTRLQVETTSGGFSVEARQ